ncbi:hypothetical protein QAD02_007539 [Eretmocerus hayati]|uniref:Uncharacterized protein n=1 Tax=Eretmocerus hayati TaxID=131215 RepID=A0ACC2N6D9_9HYME|nr:hypothetical protein QAD02_007539 [Eretmocerus hayati]
MQKKLPLLTILPAPSTTEVDTVSQYFAESNKKKFYKKINYCSHCVGMFSRIDRHMLSAHQDLQEIQQILFLPVRTTGILSEEQKERLILIERMRFRMNHVWNNDRVKNPTGIILTCRRRRRIQATSKQGIEQEDAAEDNDTPREVKKSSKFVPVRVPCQFCFGWFAAQSLTQHIRNKLPEMINAHAKARITLLDVMSQIPSTTTREQGSRLLRKDLVKWQRTRLGS